MYAKLLGNVNIADPLSLEERIIDMQFQNKWLQGELSVLRKEKAAREKAQKELKEMTQTVLELEEEDT